MSQSNKCTRFTTPDGDCKHTMSIAELNNSMHGISVLLDVDVSVYSTDDITSFNNMLHDLQNGAGCAEVSSNDGLDSMDVERLAREGGVVGDYMIVARPQLNSLVLHRSFNFRGVSFADIAAYIEHLHNTQCDIVVFSKTLAGENSVFNINLRQGNLTTDVTAMLTPENGYAVEHFLDAIERVLQSNTQIMVDDNLELFP